MESRIEIINPYSNCIFKSHYDFDYENVIPKCKELLYSAPSEFELVTKGGSSHQNAKQPHEIPELKEYFESEIYQLNATFGAPNCNKNNCPANL